MSLGFHINRWLLTTTAPCALTALAVLSNLSTANAACTPAAVDASNPAPGSTVTCSGATTDQNGGTGYGTGNQTGITINVLSGATLTGSVGIGVDVAAATVNNIGTITGATFGIATEGGVATVTNSGSITGTASDGVYGFSGVALTNNAGASITGFNGVHALVGAAIVTNSGTISGSNAGVYGGAGTVVTNNVGGSITGASSGIFAPFGIGNVSVFNAGTINGGSSAIQFNGSGNTLTLALTSVIFNTVFGAGADTFQLGGTGTGTFDITNIGAAAQYRGFGTFNKVGNSVWTLTGTGTFAGSMNVNSGIFNVSGDITSTGAVTVNVGGTLSVSGNMTSTSAVAVNAGGMLNVNGKITSASAVTVNTGGTLGGNGIVGNTVINGGTLAPGNSIGVLTVQGNLAFTSASTYAVEVSPTNADRTNVTGTATLGGAKVSASFSAGSYVVKQYTIVNATGGVGGTFGTVVNTNLPSGFRTSTSYDANNVYLDLNLALTQYNGLNVNQQNVANSLTNFFNSTGGIPAVFGSLSPAGLTQVSGESGAGSIQSSFDASNMFINTLLDPFNDNRNGEGGSFANAPLGYAAAKNDGTAAFAAIDRRPTGRWNVWASGYGGNSTVNGNATTGSHNTTNRIYGTAVGADYRATPNTVLGFALGGAGFNYGLDSGLGGGRADLFQAGAYLRHTMGPAYLAAALAYGWQNVSTDRTVTVSGTDRLQASFNANTFAARGEAGYRFATAFAGFTPYAALQSTSFMLPSYSESATSGSNQFALAYASKTTTNVRTELGARADKSFLVQDGVVTLRGRAAWAHDGNTDRPLTATFQTLPGASFTVNGAKPAADAALLTTGAEMKWRNGWALAGTFDGEFSSTTRSYAGKGTLRYGW